MPINKTWHEKHMMPKNATIDQRIKWHLAHQKHCACRPIPETVKTAIKARAK